MPLPEDLKGPLFNRVPAAARPPLVQILRDIEPDEDGVERAYGAGSWKVAATWADPLLPWEALFVLRDIVGCHDFGRFEKLAWECPFRFEDIPMTLAHQKFGLRAYVDKEACPDEPRAADAASRLISTLGRSIPLLRKTVLAQIADEQVSLGEVNVENHYVELRDQYVHFKELSHSSLRAADAAKPTTTTVTHGDGLVSIMGTNPAYGLRRKAGFEKNAAVHAFFSLLEHLLLIAFYLSGKDVTNGELSGFVGSGWSEKFKRVVDLGDRESKRQYDRLVEIHDAVRNPAAHGKVRSDGTDFSFLLPGVGPVPSHLVVTPTGRRSYLWKQSGLSAPVWEGLDRAEGWISSGPLAAASRYGESGLSLYFSDSLRSEFVAVAQDLDALDELISHVSRAADDAMNMDW